MENLLSLLDTLQEMGWAVEVFAAVAITLIARYVAMRILKVMARHLAKTENVWDDALFEAARAPLSWLILIIGLLWAIEISDGYIESELFSPDNLDLVRQLTFILLISIFMVRFITLAEATIVKKLNAAPSSEQTRLDPTTIHALAKLLRLSAVITAALVVLPTLGIEITALSFGMVEPPIESPMLSVTFCRHIPLTVRTDPCKLV